MQIQIFLALKKSQSLRLNKIDKIIFCKKVFLQKIDIKAATSTNL